jgi:hypothetical protein
VVLEAAILYLEQEIAGTAATEFTLSSDSWRIALDLEMNTYQEVITTIRLGLLQVENFKSIHCIFRLIF